MFGKAKQELAQQLFRSDFFGVLKYLNLATISVSIAIFAKK